MDVREKLVELFYKGVRCPGVIDNCNDCPHHSLENPCDEFGATADMLIANGVTVQEWISVKDRLPEHGDIVLCHTKHDDLLVFQWCEMSHRWVDQYEDYRQEYITHWMPLPQPPKGE